MKFGSYLRMGTALSVGIALGACQGPVDTQDGILSALMAGIQREYARKQDCLDYLDRFLEGLSA